ncbi:hypothetical protein WAI453_011000 [Rhynchosporium graminicola]|uniref:DUF7704 domain-containing protein n=1 Tax=Rhynchosporium graminicola TaxID=2792576 RepID=A0A1E1L075_9HELO|nr:uncharacterized protein RCO7_11105 [Rhynchosporium commune]
MSNIPTFYRIFFLYIDPLICLSGVYIFFFDHATYLASGVPHTLSGYTIDSLSQHLLRALGSYSLCILAIQLLLLHRYSEVKIWRIVQFGLLLVDLGLLQSIQAADGFRDPSNWTSGDWTNNGILIAVAMIRSAFLLTVRTPLLLRDQSGGLSREEDRGSK